MLIGLIKIQTLFGFEDMAMVLSGEKADRRSDLYNWLKEGKGNQILQTRHGGNK